MSKLSNKQNVRLGGLIAVLGGREPYESILNALIKNDFVERLNNDLVLTEKGINEKDRLSILAGLMVEKDYVAQRPRNLDAVSKSQ
jgi:hypothetical protein